MKYIKCPKCGEFFEENLVSCPSCGWSESTSSPNVTVGEKISVATTDTGTKNESTIKTIGDYIWYLSVALAIIFSVNMVIKYFAENSDINIPESTHELGLFIGSILTILSYLFVISVILIGVGRLIKEFCHVIANISINLHEINMKTKDNRTTEQE